jgi:3-deoxy-D-arabino-heptulosonate 7-phosphate (DAHP) synthase class II
MIWIGDRTRQPDGMRMSSILRGVKNPIGLQMRPVADAGRIC